MHQINRFSGTVGSLLVTLSSAVAASPFDTEHATVGFLDGNFGEEVEISGNLLLSNAPEYFTSYTTLGTYGYEGRAYLHNATTGEYLHTFYSPSPHIRGKFAESIALDGDRVLISTVDDNGISILIYDLVSGAVLDELVEPPSTPSGPCNQTGHSAFGIDLDLQGNLALVGARGFCDQQVYEGAAYLFDISTGQVIHTLKNPTPGSYDYFGNTVAIEGDYLVIGAHGTDNNTGQAFVFDKNTGNLLHTLDNPNPSADDVWDYFGQYIATEGGEAYIAAHWYGDYDAGEYHTGIVYAFNLATGALIDTYENPTGVEDTFFGYPLAVTDKYVGIGISAGVGSGDRNMLLYDRSSGDLIQTFEDVGETALDIDGELLAIDAPGGFVSIFDNRRQVPMDLKPGGWANRINTKAAGSFSAAFLSESIALGDPGDFDATTIEDASVSLIARISTALPDPAAPAAIIEDKNDDSLDDKTWQFQRQDTGLVCDDSGSVVMTGVTSSGEEIYGVDSFQTTECPSAGCHP